MSSSRRRRTTSCGAAHHAASDTVIVAFTNVFGRFDETDLLFDQVVAKVLGDPAPGGAVTD